MAMTFEQARRCKAGKQIIKGNCIFNETEWNQWVAETKELWNNMEIACDVAAMEGLTINEIEDLIL